MKAADTQRNLIYLTTKKYKGMIIINTTTKELSEAKDALNEVREFKASGVEVAQEKLFGIIETMAKIIERSVLEENARIVSPLGYDLTDFCNAIERQCPPSLMSAFCTQSKSELADLFGRISTTQLKEDTEGGIIEKFNSVNSTLLLCSKFFSLICDTVAGDDLPIMEGEEGEKIKKALIFANSPAMADLLNTLLKKYGCESYDELAKILKAKSELLELNKNNINN